MKQLSFRRCHARTALSWRTRLSKRSVRAPRLSPRMAHKGFDELDGPIVRVGGPFVPVPFSRKLEAEYMPSETQVIQAARATYG